MTAFSFVRTFAKRQTQRFVSPLTFSATHRSNLPLSNKLTCRLNSSNSMAQRLGPPGLKSAPARRDRDPSGWDGIEIVPDSEEEERIRFVAALASRYSALCARLCPRKLIARSPL